MKIENASATDKPNAKDAMGDVPPANESNEGTTTRGGLRSSNTPPTALSSRMTIAALTIATLSMLGTVANSFFNYWRYGKSQVPVITVRCRMNDLSRIQFPAAEPFYRGIGKFEMLGKSPQTRTTVDFRDYPKMIEAEMECRVTNEGEKPVSIEEFRAAYVFYYSEDSWVSMLGFFPIGEIYGENHSAAKLPHLFVPGEEQVYWVNVFWPLHNKAVEQYQKACSEVFVPNAILGNLLSCLDYNQLRLSDNPGWSGIRRLEIFAVQANGQTFHGGGTRYRLDERWF